MINGFRLKIYLHDSFSSWFGKFRYPVTYTPVIHCRKLHSRDFQVVQNLHANMFYTKSGHLRLDVGDIAMFAIKCFSTPQLSTLTFCFLLGLCQKRLDANTINKYKYMQLVRDGANVLIVRPCMVLLN